MPFPLLLLLPVAKVVAAKLAIVHAVTPLAPTLTGHGMAGVALPHIVTGAAVHTTAAHLAVAGAGKAGAVAGKALATHMVAGVVHTLPVHILPMHAVVDVAVTTGVAAGTTGAVAFSPTVSHAMTKFAEKFATGYGITRVRKELGGAINLGSIRRWFAAHPGADGSIPVTATGTVRGGRFYPNECPPSGTTDVLQGVYNPKTNGLSMSRLLEGVQVSSPVRAGHTKSGLAFYLTESALLPAR
ncbi:MAG: hypothetical protein ABJD68_02855 [Nakamurella sp.]